MMRKICHNVDELTNAIEEIFETCMTWDFPLKVSGSIEVKPQIGTILYGYKYHRNGLAESHLDSLVLKWAIGRDTFDIATRLNQRLCDAGKLVDHEYINDASHIISIGHGTWAHDGSTCYHDYRVKMSDTDAVLSAIKFGGRLKSVI